MPTQEPLSLISRWFIRPGSEQTVIKAVEELAQQVQANEPDTLTYLVHTPFCGDPATQSLPPSDPQSLLFFEVYRDQAAFQRHVRGTIFTDFVGTYGKYFVSADGKPFTTVEFLARRTGFIGDTLQAEEMAETTPNQHPAVMFELIGKDQQNLKNFYSDVFGWRYQNGTGDFAYIHFPLQTLPLMGGIGQADPKISGFEPGHNFYLLVENVKDTIDRACGSGGTLLMERTTIDGYTLGMIKDPEGNPIGLIEPFSGSPGEQDNVRR